MGRIWGVGGYGPGLNAVYDTSAHIPLAGTQPHGHTEVGRRLEMWSICVPWKNR